jgi:hypothetical protein
MSKPPNREKISRRKKAKRQPPRPRVSHAPWAGYTKHEERRERALGVCPSARCRRAKLCIDPYKKLYCRRTHVSPAEQEKRHRADPLAIERQRVMPVVDPDDLTGRRERLGDLAAISRAHAAAMTARWKAGEFDHLYGPYRAKGVILRPPPRIYVEWPGR